MFNMEIEGQPYRHVAKEWRKCTDTCTPENCDSQYLIAVYKAVQLTEEI